MKLVIVMSRADFQLRPLTRVSSMVIRWWCLAKADHSLVVELSIYLKVWEIVFSAETIDRGSNANEDNRDNHYLKLNKHYLF